MERFHELMMLSKRSIKHADHILTQTYPMLRDVKLFLPVLENVFLGMSYAMTALLHYEAYYKRIEFFKDDFMTKLHLFNQECLPKYDIRREYILLMQKVRELLIAHKKSPVEFTRKDVFVICTEGYNMKTISAEITGRYLGLAKSFISDIESIVGNPMRKLKA